MQGVNEQHEETKIVKKSFLHLLKLFLIIQGVLRN